MPKKTAYTIVAVILGIIILGLAVFYFLFLNVPSSGLEIPENNEQAINNGGGFTGGNNNQGQTGGTPQATSTPSVPGEVILPKLRKIAQGPVAGGTVFERTTEVTQNGKKVKITDTVIRYIERVKGLIYETKTSSLDTERISASSINKIREAFWTRDGSGLYIRYIPDGSETIETYFGKLKALPRLATTSLDIPSNINYPPQEFQGSFFPKNIQELIPSATNSTVFYLRMNADKQQGIVAQENDTRRVEVFSSVLSEWSPQWVTGSTVALTTKASGFVDGFLYFLNINNQNFDRVLGNLRGLTTLTSPDLSRVIYSVSQNSGFFTNIFDVKTGVSSSFPFQTLPEKCVWSKKDFSVAYCAVPQFIISQIYPDSWYQGISTFTDDLWKVNLKTGETVNLANPQSLVKERIDGVRLFLSPKEDYLFFLNKKDGSFWSLSLTQ